MCSNTKDYFSLFEQISTDFVSEINQNQTACYDLLSSIGAINEELPKIEEFYFKVKEMRMGLEKMHKTIKAHPQNK